MKERQREGECDDCVCVCIRQGARAVQRRVWRVAVLYVSTFYLTHIAAT